MVRSLFIVTKICDHEVSRPSWTLRVRTFLESWRESAWDHVSLLGLSIFRSPDREVWSRRSGPCRVCCSVHRPNWSLGQNEKLVSLDFSTRFPSFSFSGLERSRSSPLEIDQNPRSGPSEPKSQLCPQAELESGSKRKVGQFGLLYSIPNFQLPKVPKSRGPDS